MVAIYIKKRLQTCSSLGREKKLSMKTKFTISLKAWRYFELKLLWTILASFKLFQSAELSTKELSFNF